MKLPTVKNVLRKKFKGDKEGYLFLRVGMPGNKIPKFRSYNYKIPAAQWDEVSEVVKKPHIDAGQINAEISAEKDRIADLLKSEARKGTTITSDYIDAVLNPSASHGSFLRFYDSFIELQRTRHSKGYADHLLIEYNGVKRFAGNNLQFEDITSDFLERYEMSLASGKKKIAGTTLHIKMKRLKEVIAKAVDRGHIEKKKVAGYKYPPYPEPETFYLTLEQADKIFNNLKSGIYDYDSNVRSVVAFFLVECFSGIRFSDWKRFEIEKLLHDDNLKVRAKKNGEPVYLPLRVFKRLGAIIDYISANKVAFDLEEQSTNRILKSIGHDLKLKFPLTTHVGRRTCGTMLGELGYSTRAIAEVLGITEMTAKRYVKQTRQSLNNEFEKFGGI